MLLSQEINVAVATFLLLLIFSDGKKVLHKGDIILGYDFETKMDLSNIEYGKQNTQIDTTIHKHGDQSLKWNWRVKENLQFNLKQQYTTTTTTRPICGIHFWLHQIKPIDTHLKVTFINEKYKKEFVFRINLNFQNWRAIARIFKGTGLEGIGVTSISISVQDNDPYNHAGQLNLDLLRISNRCFGWTYDFINTPQLILPFTERNEIDGIEDLNGVYDSSDFWQSLYKWRKVDKHYNKKIDKFSPLTVEENRLTKELDRIEKRVDNWLFPEYDSLNSLDQLSLYKLFSLRNCDLHGMDKTSKKFQKVLFDTKHGNFAHIRQKKYKTGKWKNEVCISSAYKKYSELPNKTTGQWPSLFPSRDILPHAHENMTGLKFSQIIHHILLPMSLEYFISKRHKQRQESLKQGAKSKEEFVKVLSRELEYEPKQLQSILKNPKNINKIYRSIDNRRLRRFIRIFEHLISEGWDDGSGLGNSDHLININGGFTQALYLLRKELKSYKIFKQLINTARWFNEIGETQLQTYPHNGTTADKIKGAMLGRLYTVLASPSDTIQEIRQKIHDMKNMKRWIENALEINEGYGGLIKPDYTGYHHKGPYMSAYIPNALQAMSLVSYFLHDTPFAISRKHLRNLQNAVKTFYIISNNHEIPVAVSGAKIAAVNSKAQGEVLPAFAYLALSLNDNQVGLNSEMASMFLKLYKPDEMLVRKYLVQGMPYAASQYLNSVGSITIFEHVRKLALRNNIKPGVSAEGNWVYPYAALSVHKRKGWTVSVKGFNKYVWDYESLVDQNNYGRYLSHGQLQIIADRSMLSDVYDYFSGWDWNKIPGTTTIQLPISQLESHARCRYFQKSTMVGGLTFRKRQGIFVMDFHQPNYYQKSKYAALLPSQRSEFSFKKSYFFFEDMIICLGSNIRKSGLQNDHVITTLFQNKLKGNEFIRLDNKIFKRGKPGLNKTINIKEPITFVDVDNNGYFVPASTNNKVSMLISKNIDPRTPNGLPIPKNKTKWYASVTLDHGTSPQDDQYEYVVLTNKGAIELELFKQKMFPYNLGPKPYTVLRKDNIAHVVQFERGTTVYTGYTIFDHQQFFGGIDQHFVYKVNRPCVLMVKESNKYATLSVMDPDLRLFDQPLRNTRDIDENMLYHAKSKPAVIEITFNEAVELTRKFRKEKNYNVSKIYTERNDFGDTRYKINVTLSHGRTVDIGFKKKN